MYFDNINSTTFENTFQHPFSMHLRCVYKFLVVAVVFCIYKLFLDKYYCH